jgi:predicted ATPase
MLIQELQIEGFRSLKSVTWNPGRLNVLIGPNGGGKSNLLRALDLLRVAATGELRDAIIRMGGMAPLVWDGVARRILLKVGFSYENSIPLSYELELSRLGNTGSFTVSAEHLTRGDDVELSSRSLLQLIRSTLGTLEELDSETLLSQSPKSIGLPPPHFHPGAIILGTRTAMSNWSIYNDVRVDQEAEIRRAAVTRAEKRVAPDGQNLIAALHTLYEGDRQFEDFLDNAMRSAFPDDYDKLTFPPAEDGRTQMRIRRKHRKRADNASDLSDGTLRFLLLIAILGSSDPAPLIAIDEPEAGLHPRMLPIIAEIATNAAMKTQVVFTTHSPNLLDAFGDDLPTTTVVTSNGAETELKTIGGEELARWVKDYSLGRFAFSGEADAVL